MKQNRGAILKSAMEIFGERKKQVCNALRDTEAKE